MIRLQRRHLFGATALAGLLASAPALAQSRGPDTGVPTAAQPATGQASPLQSTPSGAAVEATSEASAAAVSEVVVTGSRIRRPDLTSNSPISVVSTTDLAAKGITNVADAINRIPGLGQTNAFTPIGDQASFSTGRNYASIYNLGSQRTLTLVNSRRFVGAQPASQFAGAAGGQVDLNSIPDAFIDNIQIYTGGGAATYGSDAVAGVINVILKRSYEGLEFDVQGAGSADRGDYPTYRTRVIFGKNFLNDRANVAFSYEYNSTDQLLYTDRRRTNTQFFNAPNPRNVSSTDGIPATIYEANRRLPELTLNGVVTLTPGAPANLAALNAALPRNIINGVSTPLAFDASGALVPYNIGIYYGSTLAAGGDGLNLAPLTSLQSPVDRHLVNGIGHFDINDHMRLRGELLLARVDATEPVNQPIFNSSLFGGTSAAYAFNINNPLLSTQARNALIAAAPNQQTFYLNRASTDIVGNSQVESRSDTMRGALTFEGDFSILGRRFNYDVGGTYGVAQGYFISPGINQEKFAYATNVVRDAAGNAACAVTVAGATNANARGCQPLNLFGFGNESPAALAYINQEFRSDYYQTQQDYQANINGTLFELPGGALNAAIGYEHRREEAKFKPGLAAAAGLGRSVPISPARGGFNTNEVYGELNIPLIGRDFTFPLLRGLEVDIKGRHVENSLAGAANAHSYEISYKPFRDLTLRATTQQTFRAPAITELFLPQSSAFSTATDPCDFRSINAGARPATRAANCASDFGALGATLANFQSRVQAATIPIITGGNPNLLNERAKSRTYGFVYQPSFIKNLSIALDVTRIDLRGAISSFTLTSILSTCYDQANRPADVCSLFRRRPDGQIEDFPLTSFVNAGFQNFEGQTLTVNYNVDINSIPGFDAPNLGNYGIRFRLFHDQRRDSSVSGTGLDIVRNSGIIGDSRYQAQLTQIYTNGPFSAIWETRYLSSARINNTFTVENQQILGVGDYFVNDVSFSYRFRNFTFRGGVQNLLDKEPPFGTPGIQIYDNVGRYFFGGVNAKF